MIKHGEMPENRRTLKKHPKVAWVRYPAKGDPSYSWRAGPENGSAHGGFRHQGRL